MPELDPTPVLSNTMTECTRCAIYLRQSLDATGEQSAITRQREDNLKLAHRRGWTVVAEHADNDLTASGKKRRPGFEQLLADIQDGQIDVIVAWSLDRLTRNRPDTVRLIEVCQPRGVTISLVRGSDIDMSTPAGRLTADILSSVARHEIEQKADRQRRAALQRAEQGKPPLGTRLTGYTPAGDVVEHEADVVRDIFDRFAAGDSLRAIAAWLTESEHTTRHGRRWNPSTVRDILANPRYAGRAIYDGQENGKAGTWKAIVEDETFELVKARLADPRRKTNKVGTDRKHLGSGLFECGVCGQKISSWSGGRYRCPQGCVNRVRPAIDALVLDVVRGRLARRDLASLLTPAKSAEGRKTIAQAKRLRERLTAIGADYDAGLIDGHRYKIATDRVNSDLVAVEAALARIAVGSDAAKILAASDPVRAFDDAPLMIRRNVLDLLCRVSLARAPRGRHFFDPESVRVEWR